MIHVCENKEFHVCENKEFHVYEDETLCSCKYNIILLIRRIILYDDSYL